MKQHPHPSPTAAWRRLCLLLTLLTGLSWLPAASAQSYLLTNLWSIKPGAAGYSFLTNDNNCRGLAYNPVSDHVLVVSRTGGSNGVYILNSTNGTLLGNLPIDPTVVTNGTFGVNMVSVTDDGVIYVCNLTVNALNATNLFKLYRWADETSQPVLVYSGDPSAGTLFGSSPQRYGDSMALRGTGPNTQILLGTLNQTVALLTTTDGINFTATRIVTDAPASDSRWGLAWGEGDTFWVKQSTGNLRRLKLDVGAGTAATVTNIVLSGATGGPLDVDSSRNLLAVIDTTTHALRLYDILDSTNAVLQGTAKSFPTTTNANGNATGAVTLRNGRLYALESNEGIQAFALYQGTFAPTITIQPASASVWEGALNYVLSVNGGGSRPFYCQWQLAGTNIPGATASTLLIPQVTYDKAGAYTVTISNAIGTVTSSTATITLSPSMRSAQMTNCAKVLAGTRPYLTFRPGTVDTVAGYRDYGMAINPVTTNILIVTRPDPTNMIAVLDIQGNHKYYLDYSGLTVLGMNRVAIADDGVVYVCNLTTSTATPFEVYAYENDSQTPYKWKAFSGDPGLGYTPTTNGWGGNFSVRGSAENTEILIGHVNAGCKALAVLKTDGSGAFVSYPITNLDSRLPAGYARLGLCFGPDNTVWAKSNNGNLYLIQYDLATGSGAMLNSYPQVMTLPNITRFVPPSVTSLRYEPTTKLLMGIQNSLSPAPVSMLVYDVADPDSGPFLVDHELLPTYNSDIEFQGTMDSAKGYVAALGVNNGLTVFKIDPAFVSIPRILSQPASATAYVSTTAGFSVVAESNPAGVTYQWYYNGTLLADATDSALSLTNIQTNQAGLYSVRVYNTGGYRESLPAVLTVLEPAASAQLTNIWSLTPGSRTYLNTDYKEYGMAFNPATSNLLVISLEGGGTVIAVLDALTGADKHTLDVGIVSGGSKVLHKIDVADDGVVYAGNLTSTANTSPFKLYRWDNDSPTTAPMLVYSGDPATVYNPNSYAGYTFDCRGAGVNTEIILGTYNTNVVAFLKTTDGTNFTASSVKVTNAPVKFSRLGLCFASGNTFWAKTWVNDAGGGRLYLCQYDLATGMGTVLKTYTPPLQVSATVTAIAYNDNLGLLAGIANDTQKNVMMYDVSNLTTGPQLRDQKLFPVYNSSIEANGDLDFGGNTYLFALSENNGIMAFLINAKYGKFKILATTPNAGGVTLTWEAVNGGRYQVQRAASVNGTWSDLGGSITGTGDSATFTDTTPDPSMRFYRVLCR